jgi:hypothetical protein
MMIYNDLNLKFQKNISMSTLTTQIQNFLQHLNDKKDIWWDLASRNRHYNTIQTAKSWVNYSSKSNANYQSKFQNQFSIYFQSKFDQYDSQYLKQRNSEYSQRRQSFYQYDANQFYQSQSQNFSSVKQLKSSKSRLQIIDSRQQSEFAFFSKSYSSRFDQNNNREEYDRRESLKRAWNNQNRDNNYNRSKAQEVYADATEKNQKNAKNSQNYQNNESELETNEFDNEIHEFYELEKSDYRSKKFNYFLNEDEYHIDIDVVQKKITFQCRKCKTKFIFNNKLYKHIRECRKKTKFVNLMNIFHLNKIKNDEESRIIIFKTKSTSLKNWLFARDISQLSSLEYSRMNHWTSYVLISIAQCH